MTKAERHKIYKEALKIVKDRSADNCCVCIILDDISDGILFHQQGEFFPEWYRNKPEEKGRLTSWWSEDEKGKKIRMKFLKQCIKETAPKKQTA